MAYRICPEETAQTDALPQDARPKACCAQWADSAKPRQNQSTSGCIGCGTSDDLIAVTTSYGTHPICQGCIPRQRYVYAVEAVESGRVKIGIAEDPAKRLQGHQVSSPERLRLLKVVPGDRKLERELHRRFADSRLHGEWFAPTLEISAWLSEATSGFEPLDTASRHLLRAKTSLVRRRCDESLPAL